ncbi:stalk domain-containing protein [Quadrisphaera oryzae]|uniref:stalk domain-containing protein n=1 Tax=Quadrisphaera TaxID=317661 RepID=UPI00164876A3|nr:stalk domain-containing protein [Quadrisphaera sp. RL12-1S]MBC3761417.1 hypothetical protein [Quadrisphaera sp. RL12-1S]
MSADAALLQVPSGLPVLRPGTPLEGDRDYLPAALRGSDLVVNESGNNSLPYPDGLREHHGELVPGQQNTWYCYVPRSLRPGTAPPLVVSVHGGLMTGWGQAVYSSWTVVAEREGLVVVFPDATSRRVWTLEVPPDQVAAVCTPNPSGIWLDHPAERAEDHADMRFLHALIDWAVAEHHVDPCRVHLHGMSMGHVMSDQFARHAGHRLAGLAGSGGLTAPQLLVDDDGAPRNAGGPVPVLMCLAEHDTAPPFTGSSVREVLRSDLDYWKAVNGVEGPPQIAVRGRDNYAFYAGRRADVVLRDVKDRDHGQTIDDAEVVWDLLFSGVRRTADGRLEHSAPLVPRAGDAVAVAVAEGADHAWVGQRAVPVGGAVLRRQVLKHHGVEGDPLVRAQHLYAPVGFLGAAFGVRVSTSEDGTTAEAELPDGRHLAVARGSAACLVDGRVRAMDAEAVLLGGQLWLPVEWFAVDLLGLRASACGRVLYVTDHHAELSTHLAHLIEDLLDAGTSA